MALKIESRFPYREIELDNRSHVNELASYLDSSWRRFRSSCISSSVIWEKFSYQKPTAWNRFGVTAQMTSSTSALNSSHVSGEAVGDSNNDTGWL